MFGNVGAATDVVRRLQGDKHCGSLLQRRTTNLCQASLSTTANICSLTTSTRRIKPATRKEEMERKEGRRRKSEEKEEECRDEER